LVQLRSARCRPHARAPRCSRSPSAGSASAPPSSRRWACCPRSPATSASRSPSPGTPSPRTRSGSSSAPRRSLPWAPGWTAAGSSCCSWSRSRWATSCPRSRRAWAGWCSHGSSPGCRTARTSGSARSWAQRSWDPEKRGRAVAAMMAGLTVACAVGVPLSAIVGHAVGWRWAFVGVGVLGLVTLAALHAWTPSLPSLPGDHRPDRARRPAQTGGSGSRSVPARSGSAACSPSTPTSSRCSPT
jgi:MFS family permease